MWFQSSVPGAQFSFCVILVHYMGKDKYLLKSVLHLKSLTNFQSIWWLIFFFPFSVPYFQTRSMQWTYVINGLPPQSVPPPTAAKVVCTSSYIGSSTVRQRNFVRENLKLTTTGASSPIKGAPLVLRKKQRKLWSVNFFGERTNKLCR